ncbi:hypothetical protein H7T43_14410 [Peribacillus simplex]|nr:hypothetical protein [Peribacillus simplex]
MKEARQKIGEYLQKSEHALDKIFEHQCIIHTRKHNPPDSEEWTVERYLMGV